MATEVFDPDNVDQKRDKSKNTPLVLDVGFGASYNTHGLFYQFDERLCADKDGNIVPAGDTRAVKLVGAKGQRISLSEAIQLGVLTEKEAQDAIKKKSAPANKKARTAKNKGIK